MCWLKLTEGEVIEASFLTKFRREHWADDNAESLTRRKTYIGITQFAYFRTNPQRGESIPWFPELVHLDQKVDVRGFNVDWMRQLNKDEFDMGRHMQWCLLKVTLRKIPLGNSDWIGISKMNQSDQVD